MGPDDIPGLLEMISRRRATSALRLLGSDMMRSSCKA